MNAKTPSRQATPPIKGNTIFFESILASWRLGVRIILALSLMNSIAAAQTTQPAAPRIKLWTTTPGVVEGKDTDTDPTEPTMDIYLPPRAGAPGAAMLVLPGGAYTHLSTIREGSDIAHMLVSHGIAAFVVRYRHSPRYQYPIPFLDGQRALRTVRANAADYGVDPDKIGVIGFSAGGHLAASLATQFDAGDPNAADPVERVSSRPDFAALLYPVITLTDEPYVHKGSRQALTGDRRELWASLSADQRVTPTTPPVFIAQATTDTVVPPQNSILFYSACLQNHVPAELHMFAHGSHGFGLAPTDSALSVWPQLLVTWMARNHWTPAAN
jgi:acetyl esterase/lipase